MNFKEFRATKKYLKDLSQVTNELEHKDVPGFIYLDNYYIFDAIFTLDYYLILENLEFINKNLLVLEKRLYEYCKQIGALDEV